MVAVSVAAARPEHLIAFDPESDIVPIPFTHVDRKIYATGYGRGTKVTPPGFDCLCCYLPECDRAPHCQAGIEPQVVLDAVKSWL